MVVALVDTSVIVDILRFYQPAQQWFAQQGALGVTPVVWLEVLEGIENRRKLAQATAVLKPFEQIETLPLDMDWAVSRLAQYKLSHNVDAFDCLIAAVSQRLQLPLYTANLKHFAPLLGPLAQKPY